MPSVGSIIYGSDYNGVQTKARGVLNDGNGYGGPTAGYGYGTATSSAAVNPNDKINATQWNNLVADLNACYVHQNGSNFPGYATISGSITNANFQTLDGIGTSIINNRGSAAATQLTKTSVRTNTRSVAWGGGNSGITSQTRFTWNSTNDMWTFFNSGGSFQAVGIPTNGSSTSQDISWNGLLNAFNYTTTYSNFTSAYNVRNNKGNVITLYTSSGSTPYASNSINFYMWITSDREVNLQITYNDGHVATGAGPDSVSAGAGYTLYRSISSGAVSGISYATQTNDSSFG